MIKMMSTKEILKTVKKIEIRTKQLVEGLIAGNYHSIFKGRGIDFSEIREYAQGDDIRAIDWNVTARFNKPFIKEFIEERDLDVYFALDISASGDFGDLTAKKRKSAEMIATLMFSAMRNNDNISLFLFTDSVEKYFRPRKGRRHVLKLISSIVTYGPASKKTDIRKSLEFVSNVVKKKGIIFVISDFASSDFMKPLRILKNKHDVIAVRVYDKREKSLPDVGLIELEDEETGEQLLVDTSDEEFRRNYENLISVKDKKLAADLLKYKIDVVDINTKDAFEKPLENFFKRRMNHGRV